MRRLLDDLLLLARTDAAGTEPPLRLRTVDLGVLVQEAVRVSAPLAHGQTLSAIADAAPLALGDPDRLLQLLLILIENALRHTPSGGTVEVTADRDREGRSRLTVRDTGEGILDKHIPHLFDRFYRADGARDRTSGGTGLGLAIAKAIVELHGGSIVVISRPGNGATFTVLLPAAPGTSHVAIGEEAVPRLSAPAPPE